MTLSLPNAGATTFSHTTVTQNIILHGGPKQRIVPNELIHKSAVHVKETAHPSEGNVLARGAVRQRDGHEVVLRHKVVAGAREHGVQAARRRDDERVADDGAHLAQEHLAVAVALRHHARQTAPVRVHVQRAQRVVEGDGGEAVAAAAGRQVCAAAEVRHAVHLDLAVVLLQVRVRREAHAAHRRGAEELVARHGQRLDVEVAEKIGVAPRLRERDRRAQQRRVQVDRVGHGVADDVRQHGVHGDEVLRRARLRRARRREQQQRAVRLRGVHLRHRLAERLRVRRAVGVGREDTHAQVQLLRHLLARVVRVLGEEQYRAHGVVRRCRQLGEHAARLAGQTVALPPQAGEVALRAAGRDEAAALVLGQVVQAREHAHDVTLGVATVHTPRLGAVHGPADVVEAQVGVRALVDAEGLAGHKARGALFDVNAVGGVLPVQEVNHCHRVADFRPDHVFKRNIEGQVLHLEVRLDVEGLEHGVDGERRVARPAGTQLVLVDAVGADADDTRTCAGGVGDDVLLILEGQNKVRTSYADLVL
eukprot:PhM_4_TR17425/c0_g1_i1/m.77954